MAFGYASIQHAMAAVANEAVVVAKKVSDAIKKVGGQEQTIEDITALVAPEAVAYERAAFTALGLIAHACDSLGDAAGANGVNITLDAAMIADFKAVAKTLKADVAAKGLNPATGQ